MSLFHATPFTLYYYKWVISKLKSELTIDGVENELGKIVEGAIDIKEEGKDVPNRVIQYDSLTKWLLMYVNKMSIGSRIETA